MQVEIDKYQEAMELLRDILNYSQFDSEHIKPSVFKLLNSIPAIKRKGDQMVKIIAKEVNPFLNLCTNTFY